MFKIHRTFSRKCRTSLKQDSSFDLVLVIFSLISFVFPENVPENVNCCKNKLFTLNVNMRILFCHIFYFLITYLLKVVLVAACIFIFVSRKVRFPWEFNALQEVWCEYDVWMVDGIGGGQYCGRMLLSCRKDIKAIILQGYAEKIFIRSSSSLTLT